MKKKHIFLLILILINLIELILVKNDKWCFIFPFFPSLQAYMTYLLFSLMCMMIRQPTFQVLLASTEAVEEDGPLLSSLSWSVALVDSRRADLGPDSLIRKTLDRCNISFKVVLQKSPMTPDGLVRVLDFVDRTNFQAMRDFEVDGSLNNLMHTFTHLYITYLIFLLGTSGSRRG